MGRNYWIISFLIVTPLGATISNQQAPLATYSQNSCTSCSRTISSTTAGNTLVLILNGTTNTATVTVSAPAGMTEATLANCNNSNASQSRNHIYYKQNIAAGITTVSWSFSAGGDYGDVIFELHSTAGSNYPAYDTAGCLATTTSTNTAYGPNLSPTGSNDILISAAFWGPTTPVSVGGGYTLITPNYEGSSAYLLNSTVGTGPLWTINANENRWAVSGIAFSEPSASVTSAKSNRVKLRRFLLQ
jgi:hypothetical protein